MLFGSLMKDSFGTNAVIDQKEASESHVGPRQFFPNHGITQRTYAGTAIPFRNGEAEKPQCLGLFYQIFGDPAFLFNNFSDGVYFVFHKPTNHVLEYRDLFR